jgi:hypothetical protein
MKRSPTPASLVAMLYCWSITAFFGAILLDVVYAGLLVEHGEAVDLDAVFRPVSDMLLRIGGVVAISGFATVALSWNTKPARNRFLASLLVVSLEFVVPVLFSVLFGSGPGGPAIPFDPVIRPIVTGLASILAFAGSRRLDGRT